LRNAPERRKIPLHRTTSHVRPKAFYVVTRPAA
jgi:hypothetical protein